MYKKLYIKNFRLFHEQTIHFGKLLTVLSGRNSTGKSTILGMIANSGELKKKYGVSYLSRPFRSEFSELFRASEKFDLRGSDRFEIRLCNGKGEDTDYRSFRTAWQLKDKYRKTSKQGVQNALTSEQPNDITVDLGSNANQRRFRVIPYKKLDNNKITEAKFSYPILYLGLSRLFPLGESHDASISNKPVIFKTEDHRDWFIDKYTEILSMQNKVLDIRSCSISETDKKNGIGVSTDQYDFLANSSGQDNLGQILLALLSFKKLKEESSAQWQGGILLIDEVDATLHPSAQRKLLQVLIQEARIIGIQIMVTTHSLTILKDVCSKIDYNKDSCNNNIELYYLTNANRKLEIKRNISFTEIESDLTISSVVQNNRKIKLYSEDAEARWFISFLVDDYLANVAIMDVSLGCDQLINLYNADILYFSNVLLVLDGDVDISKVENLNKNRERSNVILLPGGKRPEEVIYDYIISLNSEHEFWDLGAQCGFTWDYFKTNGPLCDQYSGFSERERYKKWFNNHKNLFESLHLMEYWKKDNKELVKNFRMEFKNTHNNIAKRVMAFPIV